MVQAIEGRTTVIGIQGENKARQIKIFVGDILAEFPGAVITLVHQRANDQAAYPVASTEIQGNFLVWTVSSGDTAQAGDGKCELIATLNDVVVKTVTYGTRVHASLSNTATPPDPWTDWVNSVIDAAEEAEAAAALLASPTAEATTLEPGQSATASYSDGVFNFGIPAGTPGQDGHDGTDGADGFSPSASVSKSGSVATISITDKDGTTTATVSDGASYTPVQWELIKSGSATNETASAYEITTDDNGNPLALTDVLFVLVTPQQETQAELGSYGRIYFFFDTNNYETAYVGTYTQAPNSAAKSSTAIITQENGLRRMGYFKNTTTGGDGSELNHANNSPAGNTDGLLVCAERTYSKIQIGSITGTFNYKLYGKRKS